MSETNVIKNKENNIEWNIGHSVGENNKFNIVNNIISSDVNCDDRNNENKYNIKCERMTKYNIGNIEN